MGFGLGDRRRGGFVLVAVLVVVMLASMLAVSLIFRLQAEQAASSSGIQSEQAWSAALAGVREAMGVVGDIPPGSLEWRDSPSTFEGRLVYGDGVDRWYFTVYSPGDSDTGGIRYGLTDEASKVNINEAHTPNLVRLMEKPLVDAIRDYVDADDLVREEGAEREEYFSEGEGHEPRNGPLTTLDEILLVRGFTPALFYGEDANLNDRLDANEDDGDERFPADNSDGELDRGLRRYFTVSSYDLNVDNYGVSRLDLNNPSEPLDGVELPGATKDFIAAMRLEKARFNHPSELLEARRKFASVKGTNAEGANVEFPERELDSGVGVNELGLVLDRLTATADEQLPGLLNLNTASAKALLSIPDVDESLADAMVSAREQLDPSDRQNIAWLFRDGLVDADRFKRIAPFLTTRSYQFGFRCVGYGVPTGRYRVLEVIIDAGGETPVISYLRDITRQGLPFPLPLEEETEGFDG